MDIWSWLSASLPAGAIVNGLGLGSLALLFATDRILTKGQHMRRVADIVNAHILAIGELGKHYDELAAAKDAAYRELKESRDSYREAQSEDRKRADKVTDQLAEVAELARLATHLLTSFDEAAKDKTK